jgi:N-acetylmuramic acid 6-phosphate (MurNAc-6-P) etherase
VEDAGETLRGGGHIYYVAEDPTFGILGFIDASEQQPVIKMLIIHSNKILDIRCLPFRCKMFY